ncbi:amidohydrolase [Peptoniphilus equinus]|uniref:Amidohydrolase n=1 Tax=Peptoniphilus equinus TaxID=3016343 RepID=A0ABY7QU81_9FIRM|nr:amidohydrolase [Peptoniphilus equinus]WBW49921.1 amidohydrolase [Peptoniphilus equinus]
MTYNNELIQTAFNIWDFAEIKFEEFQSSKALQTLLESHGFTVQSGLAGIPTAFKATYGTGQVKIGYLGEFDALSGLSQKSGIATEEKRDDAHNGHGCGHHMLGTAAAGAALMLKDHIDKHQLDAQVIFFGCPGEEGGSGKAFMANAGVFDNLDVALSWHPYVVNAVWSGSSLANIQVFVRFHGKSTHAASAPHLGRSALDGLELLNVGVNFLREHIEEADRIHYAITDTGGISPNVVQNYAEGIYLIRSTTSEKADALYARFQKIVEGAGLMTETTPEIIFDKSASELIPNQTLERVLYEAFKLCGPPEFTPEDIRHAKQFADHATEEDIRSDPTFGMTSNPEKLYNNLKDKALCDFILDYEPSSFVMPGSTDVGNVSRVVPTSQITVGNYAVGTAAHSWQEVAQGKYDYAMKAMLKASEVLTQAGAMLLADPQLISDAKAEFQTRMKDKNKYTMPKGTMPLVLRQD